MWLCSYYITAMIFSLPKIEGNYQTIAQKPRIYKGFVPFLFLIISNSRSPETHIFVVLSQFPPGSNELFVASVSPSLFE